MQLFGEIPEYLIEWIEKQEMFWVASAPLNAEGHINISPKGVAGTFHIVDSRRVWYEDLSGSGAETISHIRENGRVTVLFNAFEGPPRIARLYCKGSVYEFGTPEYEALLPAASRHAGSRAAIVLDVYKVATTCGYSVPFYEFKGHRVQLLQWAAQREDVDRRNELSRTAHPTSTTTTVTAIASAGVRGDSSSSGGPGVPMGFSSATSPRVLPNTGLKKWWQERNTRSLDGLPGLASAHTSNKVFWHNPVHVGKKDSFAPLSSSSTSMRASSPPKAEPHLVKADNTIYLGPADARLVFAFLLGVLITAFYHRMMYYFGDVLVPS